MMFATIVDKAGAAHHAVERSLIAWNTYTSSIVPISYSVPLAKPTLYACSSPSANNTSTEATNAGIIAIATTALPACLPTNLTVKSVATTTIGNVKAAAANGNSPNNGKSAPGNTLNLIVTK